MASKLSSRKTEVKIDSEPGIPWLSIVSFCIAAGLLLNVHPVPKAGPADLELAVVERQGSETFYRDTKTKVAYRVKGDDTPAGSVWAGVRIVNERLLARVLIKGSRGTLCGPVRASNRQLVYHGGKPHDPTGLYNVETCTYRRPTP